MTDKKASNVHSFPEFSMFDRKGISFLAQPPVFPRYRLQKVPVVYRLPEETTEVVAESFQSQSKDDIKAPES